MTNKISAILAALREWATNYEPAVAATLAAALFQMLLALGISVGDWPAKVDAVLAFAAVVTTLLAGQEIRRKVASPATRKVERDYDRASYYLRGYRHGRSGADKEVPS